MTPLRTPRGGSAVNIALPAEGKDKLAVPLQQGEALFSKVIEGDAEGARQCMEEHMEDVRYNLKSTMGTDHPGQKAAIG